MVSAMPLAKPSAVFSHLRTWRFVFVITIVLRLYFGVTSSYIHPDEHFQGPEAIADQVFGWATIKSWEFTSAIPIRSYFALWVIYGIPMTLCDLLFGSHDQVVEPTTVYYSLRLMFAIASWVLNDMAVERLSPNMKSERIKTIFFVATSYVSWTYQSHTFSNSIETILVLWCLVIIHELDKTTILGKNSDAALLAVLITLGVFNRITFPVFLIIPILGLIPHFYQDPSTFVSFIGTAAATFMLGVYIDTTFYGPPSPENTLFGLPYVITPLNNILYNINTENLTLHGLHLPIQHWFVNLPQLIGPGFILLSGRRYWTGLPFQAAVSGITLLSFVPHQEPRFLLAAVPLLCCSFDVEIISRRGKTAFIAFVAVWLAFNAIMGALMGTFHQGGIIPAQIQFNDKFSDATSIVWWKTYSPPIWLLGRPEGSLSVIQPDHLSVDDSTRFLPIYEGYIHSAPKQDSMTIVDLMGAPHNVVGDVLSASSPGTYFVAPLSSFAHNSELVKLEQEGQLSKVWSTSRHISLDIIDWSDLSTLLPGLAIWKKID